MQIIHSTVDMFRFTCLLLALVAACSGASIPENRIVGGKDAREGQVPWQVSLQSNDFHFCGGAIVNQRWVVTAAHCLTVSVSSASVVTNILHQNSRGDYYRVSTFRPHPEFDRLTSRNDIGLVQTASNIVYRDTVQPARLPTSPFTASNVAAVVSGWGRTSVSGTAPNTLQVLDTFIISQSQCAALLEGLPDDHICAFTRDGEGTCQGDSGGPLTSEGILVGVVSYGQPCAVGIPDAYTRVFEYIDWMKKYTG